MLNNLYTIVLTFAGHRLYKNLIKEYILIYPNECKKKKSQFSIKLLKGLRASVVKPIYRRLSPTLVMKSLSVR